MVIAVAKIAQSLCEKGYCVDRTTHHSISIRFYGAALLHLSQKFVYSKILSEPMSWCKKMHLSLHIAILSSTGVRMAPQALTCFSLLLLKLKPTAFAAVVPQS